MPLPGWDWPNRTGSRSGPTVGYILEDGYTLLTGDGDPGQRALFRRYYVEKANPLQISTTQLFPGARALLEALRERGIPAGVVSSKKGSTLRGVLEHLDVVRLLCSVTRRRPGRRPSLTRRGSLAAVAALNLTPDQVLYCGDTILDAQAAQRSGAHFCAVLNGTTPASAFAPYPCDHIAPDLMDLKNWLGL